MSFFDKFKKKGTNSKMIDAFTEEEQEIYKKYIKKIYGDFKTVLYEVVSPDIHLDIIVVPPTEESNFYKLVTMGMSTYKMNVPEPFSKFQIDRAELVLFLPATWNLNSTKEEDFWPIRQMKNIARIPVNGNTWLSWFHTFSSDALNTPYADNTKFCGMLLTDAKDKDLKVYEGFNLPGKGKITFYQLFPLYKEELEFSFENGIEALLNEFSKDDLLPIVNIERKNYK